MHARTAILAVLLTLCCVVGFFFYWQPGERATSPVATPVALGEAFSSQWSAIRAADKIDDPAQRCLAYPDPPGLQWDAGVVQAICAPLSFRFITLDEMKAELDDERPEAIDRAFQAYFEAASTTPGRRGMLSRAYRVLFEDGTLDAKAVADRWVTAARNSAFAHTARGLQSLARALDIRGSDYVRESASTNLETMEQLIREARGDFEAALAINPKLIPAYHGLLVGAKLVGDRPAIDRYVKAALAVDPADDRIYLDWIGAAEPRWGGSLEAMRDIADSARAQVGTNPYLQLVLEKPASYKGIALANSGKYREAVDAFDKALLIAPSSADFVMAADVATAAGMPAKALWYYSESYRFFGGPKSYFSRAEVFFQAGKPELALEILADAQTKRLADIDALYIVGNSYWRAHRLQDAERSYLAVLDRSPRKREALTALSQLYLGEMKEPARAQPYVKSLIENYPRYARGWLLASFGETGPERREALQRYLELVDRSDPYEQADIRRAEAGLKELGGQGKT